MNNTFYYLVPNDYDNIKNPKNEYFIINELIKNNLNIIPIYKFNDINPNLNFDGIIFNSLKVILNNKQILEYSKKNNLPIFWWYFDTAKTKFTRKQRVIKIAKQVSIFFNKDREYFSDYIKSGINPIWLDQGVPTICTLNENNEYQYDLSFFGSYEKAHSFRSKLLKELDDKYNLAIYTKDKHKFLSRGFHNVKTFIPINMISKKIAKINLVLNSNYSSDYCWSNRLHLVIGSSGFSLVENITGLDEFYSDNIHCIYFNNKNELFEKINYWLLDSNDSRRRDIRLQGFNHAHNYNSYKIKAAFFTEKIIKFLNNINN